MRARTKMLLLAGLAATVAACEQRPDEQNVAIDINNAAPEDIEALPPDESSETPTNELVNGAQNADGNDVNAAINNY